ncbi:uncharacterized protein LOC131663322 isoform X3 [Phymastichus coffea]|uniref:uncharacterized protein LOC131663322 isoform X3 n=1 Tax=Phymastichus coffea TaxID=108790 RepID=UPI00273BDE53|nr:uncharacterized protein LOC131663322 isoform X3 [Phymastichus coffea]
MLLLNLLFYVQKDILVTTVAASARSKRSIMTRKYAIVIDTNDKKFVVPIGWISLDKTSFDYPPSNYSIAHIKKMIIEDDDVDEHFIQIPLKKIVKTCPDYITAVQEKSMNGIEVLTDPSDTEKLKISRKRRNKKIVSNEFVVPTKRHNIEQVRCSKSDASDNSDDGSLQDPLELEESASLEPVIPDELNVCSASQNTSTMYDKNKEPIVNDSTEVIMKDNENTATENTPSLQKIYDVQLLILKKVNYIS